MIKVKEEFIKNPFTKNGKIKNLVGNIYGKLTVLSLDIERMKKYYIENKKVPIYWLCQCSCENNTIISARGNHLTTGCIKSCHCTKNKMINKFNTDNLVGMKFNHWSVIDKDLSKSENGYYICECDCEKHTKQSIRYDGLINEKTKSCGCDRPKSFVDYLCSDKVKYIIGSKFGRWEVIDIDYEKSKNKRKLYLRCKCSCEKETIKSIEYYSLKDGNSTSCGCISKKLLSERKRVDLTGKKFGRLTVVKKDEDIVGRRTYFWCKCDCGNSNLILVEGRKLTYGIRKSCGCLSSKGELEVKHFLNDNSILFDEQKQYDDLLGLGYGNLSYDFYLKTYNLLIECQGKQHYEPIEYFGGEEQFKIQQEHDKRKKEYAKLNNINLLEIPYWEFDNIEKILKIKLNIKKEKI